MFIHSRSPRVQPHSRATPAPVCHVWSHRQHPLAEGQRGAVRLQHLWNLQERGGIEGQCYQASEEIGK